VQGAAASEGKPLTVTTTFVLANPNDGVTVINGSMISVAVPLSGPQVTVRVYPEPPVLAGPGPIVKAP
jgi:hypothetical protein